MFFLERRSVFVWIKVEKLYVPVFEKKRFNNGKKSESFFL